MDIDNQVNQIVKEVIADITTKIQDQVMSTVAEEITKITSKIDYETLFKLSLTSVLKDKQFTFPNNSIPATALEFENFIVSGDCITGGIIKNFGSTGIDDQSTACQVTILDEVTVVENNLLTKDLTVKGTATIEGDLNVTGTMPESSPLFQNVVQAASDRVRGSLNEIVFQSYANMVLDRIKSDGLDLTKITVNGDTVIDGGNLGHSITYSNLQKLGVLQELQVKGETLLAQTLYATSRRVGVNTIEPTQALSVWDQEVEIGIGKHGTNTGVIETPRNHALVLSSNAKNNLTLTPDGGVTVNELTLGGTNITTSNAPPTDNRAKGSIVFNKNPSLGGPLGWVSLGDARWANFGIID